MAVEGSLWCAVVSRSVCSEGGQRKDKMGSPDLIVFVALLEMD